MVSSIASGIEAPLTTSNAAVRNLNLGALFSKFAYQVCRAPLLRPSDERRLVFKGAMEPGRTGPLFLERNSVMIHRSHQPRIT